MTFDRSTIFRTAWTIARRLATAMKNSVRSHLARALRDAWKRARVDAEVARLMAVSKARREGRLPPVDIMTPGLRAVFEADGGRALNYFTPSIRPDRQLVRARGYR